MGPMGLQCDKLQKDDLDHYRQRKTSDRRTEGTQMLTYQKRHTRNSDSAISSCLYCSDFCIPTAENAKAGCIAGSVAGGHTMHVPGVSVSGLCARFTPTIKWHRIAL